MKNEKLRFDLRANKQYLMTSIKKKQSAKL